MNPLDFFIYILKYGSYGNFMELIYDYNDGIYPFVHDKVKSINSNVIKHIVWYKNEIIIVNGDLDIFVKNVINEYEKNGIRTNK